MLTLNNSLRKTLALGTAAAFAVLITACGSTATAPNPDSSVVGKTYPVDVENTFKTNCETGITAKGGAADQATAICGCTLHGLENKFSFDQFKQVDADMAGGKPLPADMNAITQECAANPSAY